MKMGIFDSQHHAHRDWLVGYVEMVPIEIRIELDASTVAIASLNMSLTTQMYGRSWATQSPSYEQDACRQLVLNDISRFKQCVLYDHDCAAETMMAISSMSGAKASSPDINIRLDLDIKYVRQFPKITKLGRFNPPTRTKNIDLKTASPAARIALTAGVASLLNDDWVREIAALPFVRFDLSVLYKTYTRDLSWIPDYNYASLTLRHQSALQTLEGMPPRVEELVIINRTRLIALTGICPNVKSLSLVNAHGGSIDVGLLDTLPRLAAFYHAGHRLPTKISTILLTNIRRVAFDMVGEFWERELIVEKDGGTNGGAILATRSTMLNRVMSECLTTASRKDIVRSFATLREHGISLT